MTDKNPTDKNIDPSPVLDRAMDLVRFLRVNCEWDAVQTPDSLIPFLLEEAHEVADAVADRDDSNLTGELGDLLLNVAFQIVLAEERHAFSADDVVRTLESKMRRRHPHLYGDGPKQDWESLKRTERADTENGTSSASPTSVLAGLPRGIDPLSKAHRIQDRVAAVGFDWPDVQGPLDKVAEELEEVRGAILAGEQTHVDEEIGDLFFAMVNLSRRARVHPVKALTSANLKFTARFEAIEKMAAERGIDMSLAGLEVLDELWNEVKTGEK